MRSTVLSIVFLLTFVVANSQGLIEVYKKNPVILEEDPRFGAKNNWKQLFYDIGATHDKGMDGKNKAIVIAPDGTVFMSHHSRHSISMYDKDGNFLKEFGKKGGKESDFVYMPTVIGIMDGKYLCTTAVDGRMLFFDLNGNWEKTVRLDFMPLGNAILKNNKIAMLGHTSWTSKYRMFVTIKDIETGKEKIIWDKFSDGAGSKEIVVKHKEGGMSSLSLPYTHSGFTRPQLLTTREGNLAMAFPETGEVKIYSPDGELIKSFTVSAGERLSVTQQDREGYYKRALEHIKAMEAAKEKADEKQKANLEESITQWNEQVQKCLNPALYPEKLPTFSQIMFDSDSNLLVFSFTKEKDQNKFSVFTYNPEGQKIAESTFVSDKYDLNFGSSKFQFYKGNVIAVQTLKDEKAEIPVRLVRFMLKN